ncbi:MAG: polysaccharide biosynthesis protein, partial [Nitrospirae bacterium]
QLAFIIVANYFAFWLRFDGVIPHEDLLLFAQMLPSLILVRGAVFIPFRLYEGLWRYTSIWDLRNIIAAVTISSVLFYVLVHGLFVQTLYPRSIFIIDSVLLICLLGGIRLTRRIYRELGHIDRYKRILIYGAGDAGEMIVRDIKNNSVYEYEPVGFIDDDQTKLGQRIHGVKVLGTRQTLVKVIPEEKPDAVLVAIPSIQPSALRKLVKALEPFKVPIKTLPNFRELQDAKVTANQIRDLVVQDLLERAPVNLRQEPLVQLLQGQRVLVTGAGGSIGSELCRQIVACRPSAVVLLDRYENGLYSVVTELSQKSQEFATAVHSIIGDITDVGRMNSIMAEYRPTVVFHAAAHKHVPLMELSPCEAVKNNVLGTKTVAEAALRHGVSRFIVISTDKAVNPTSVMGATKRVAELVIQSMNHNPHCVFAAVRFGNVLASNGSAVPHFLEQIKAGGPVTVTHPDMRRYFMLIPEAVQLVLQAASLAKGGEIFVLEMGEQIRVFDIAKNLIRLSGFSLDEIPITFVGVRPGE